MDIDEAIEINEFLLRGEFEYRGELMEKALQLGIEALKRVKVGRTKLRPQFDVKLPGED